jgi:transketolase
MLLYAILHLTGYDLSMDELKSFRQWGSLTPGHPESGHPPGVEATTGPLGQGFGNGVGMAIAERLLADRFNRPGHTVVDHRVYALVSDGDLMEGVASEAASLAGHLALGKLVYLYDDNRISIEGSTDLTFSREDVRRRFEAYGWHVVAVEEGHDVQALDAALGEGEEETGRPSLVIARTHIAHGSPNKQDTAAAHGAPLGEEEVRLTKENLGWPAEPSFLVPAEVRDAFGEAVPRGETLEAAWRQVFGGYRTEHPELADEFERMMEGRLPSGWTSALPAFSPDDGPMATRKASGKVLGALAGPVPEITGGSADLAPSNNTFLAGEGSLSATEVGRNLHFGVREHAMGAVLNGMALHGGLLPYGGTFLVFSDYMRPSIRLAALQELRVVYVLTHDSVGLGEDGPTHQPVEHLSSLRAVPNLWVFRPADANETVMGWRAAVERSDGPTALVLTRQKVPVLDRKELASAEGAARGGYVLAPESGAGSPHLILIATGSEVAVALEARAALEAEGVRTRVVSLPCVELFEDQEEAYRDEVLPPSVDARVAVEAGASHGWHRWVGRRGEVVGIDRFGASAPGKTVLEKLGITAANVVERARSVLERARAVNTP